VFLSFASLGVAGSGGLAGGFFSRFFSSLLIASSLVSSLSLEDTTVLTRSHHQQIYGALVCSKPVLRPTASANEFLEIGVMQISRLTKLQMRKPAKKPRKPAPRISSTLGNETLNWPVRNVYDMPCKIRKDATAVTSIAMALLYGASPDGVTAFAIKGPKKTAKYTEITILKAKVQLSTKPILTASHAKSAAISMPIQNTISFFSYLV